MSESRDKVNLNDLTNYQKQKLLKFYNVSSIDELEVTPDGDIIVKKQGGGKASDLKVYLEDREGDLTELDIHEFVMKQNNPTLGYNKTSPEDAMNILHKFIPTLIHGLKGTDMKTLCFEHIGKSTQEMLLFQQFVIFYSKKLKSVLCGNEINDKYIRAVGNPSYSDVDFYNVKKKSDKELIIKGFAFCGYPSKQELFINLVCGTGGTGQLIHTALMAVTNKMLQNKPKYISLESIETEQALMFYTKMGFRKPKQDTMKTINDMISTKAKTFSQYAELRHSLAGGKLYLFPHNKEGERLLKKLKCEWLYSPVTWFHTIKTLKKEKKSIKYIRDHMIETARTTRLEGEGIGEFFKGIYNKGKDFASQIPSVLLSRFKPKLDDFTNQSKATLAKYGNWRIVNVTIQRKPILGILDKFFNVLTFGKFQELKDKYGYDKLFHLQLALTVTQGGVYKKVIAEKNETVDITESNEQPDKTTQTLIVPLPRGKIITLNQLINDTRTKKGDYTFFSYDPWTNNCQYFISYLMETLGQYNDRAKGFLFQDMSNFKKEMPQWIIPFSRKITDLGATVANLRGKGKRKYITPEQRAIQRREAIGKSTYAPTVEAKKEEAKKMAEVQAYNERVSKQAKKKGIKDYQAQERYYTTLRQKEEAEKKAKEEEEKAKKEEEERKKKQAQEEKKARNVQKKKEFEEKKAQREADIRAYQEGRIDDIKDLELLRRAQTERNLSQFYDFKGKVYDTKMAQMEENFLTNLLPMAVETVMSKVPVIGDYTSRIVDASGVKDETPEERKRREYLEEGAPIRPDVLEGYYEPLVEPEYEGDGKPSKLALHAVVFNKNKYNLADARQIAKHFIKGNKNFFRETNQSYRMRNIPKQRFEKGSFKTKIVEPGMSLVFGIQKSS